MALPNAPELVLAFIGTLRAGAAAAPLNPSYTRQELDALPRGPPSPAAMLVAPGEGAAARRGVRGARDPVHELGPDGIAGTRSARGAPRGATPTTSPCCSTPAARRAGPKARAAAPAQPRRLGAHDRGELGLGADDVSHCVMPLFHVHGLVASTLATLVERRHGGRPPAVRAGALLERRRRARRDLVLGGARRSTRCCSRAPRRRRRRSTRCASPARARSALPAGAVARVRGRASASRWSRPTA